MATSLSSVCFALGVGVGLPQSVELGADLQRRHATLPPAVAATVARRRRGGGHLVYSDMPHVEGATGGQLGLAITSRIREPGTVAWKRVATGVHEPGWMVTRLRVRSTTAPSTVSRATTLTTSGASVAIATARSR